MMEVLHMEGFLEMAGGGHAPVPGGNYGPSYSI